MKNRVAILGLDTFAQKNVSQLLYLNNENFFFDIFTIDNRKSSLENIQKTDSENKLILVKRGLPGIFDRFLKILKYIHKYKSSIHHFELYPNAPYSLVYILIAKFFKIKTIVVERGDIGDFKSQSVFSKLSMNTCYKLGNIIWYKEPYMKPLLLEKGAKQLEFIHNAADYLPLQENKSFTIDFLWVNRFEQMRRSNWVIQAMQEEELKNYSCEMVGYQDTNALEKRYLNEDLIILQDYALKNKKENIKIVPFTNPSQYYSKSKFFVLPAERVFGNNSLLEAMSYGLVPIVTKKNNTNLLIKNNENGFLCDYDYDSFKRSLIKAAHLDDKEYERLSNNARNTIKDQFSNQVWTKKMIKMYNQLNLLN